MNRSNAATFDKLIEEVTQKSPSWVIINMRDLGRTIERTQFPAFARLQKVIREKPAELKLCSIHPDLKTTLQDAGLVRYNELADNLSDALASLTPLALEE
jgi:anti-anti-sigma regulatory factor